jgi:4-phosphopantoate--beta-alanine ligase
MTKIPADHPRAESLRIRERLIQHYKKGVVTVSGLIAHGRGEALDYLLGEKTSETAMKSIESATAMLLTAERAVISVNGNAAALVAKDIVELADTVGAGIEVNLFYRSLKREKTVERLLRRAGAHEVLGVGEQASARIPELNSQRRRIDPRGILTADVVLVPLEDGDRTETLVGMGKKVIAIDLNPLSRTAQKATITIVDNIVRAAPKLGETAKKLRNQDRQVLNRLALGFDNKKNLAASITAIERNLSRIAKKGMYAELGVEKIAV